eukprot:UC4_evm3s547
MTASMLNGPPSVVGNMTSGGTESILMAVKAYRDRARKLTPWIKNPEVVFSITIHPAFEKACHYFDVKAVHVPVVAETYSVNVKEVEAKINENTILLVGSAPQYPHGVMDPIEDLSCLAFKRGLPLHVDACFGGFMLPWIEKLNYPVPKWDFRVQGVTSISADVHKYGWGAKGSSILLWRSSEFRRFMIFAYADWPGGLFASPSMAGSRPGGVIAASWASLVSLGESGFLEIAKDVMETAIKMRESISKIDGLGIIGKPVMTAFAIKSTQPQVNILAVADVMEKHGWKMERQQKPDCLHCSIMPHHKDSADRFIADMAVSVKEVRANPGLAKEGTAGMYGMVAQIPDEGLVTDFLTGLFDKMYTPESSRIMG